MNNEELSQQEITSAHDALSILAAYSDGPLPTRIVRGYVQEILKALPPEPQPTMADIDWDEDEHFLAEAEDTLDGVRRIMLFPEMSEHIRCIREYPCTYTEAILREYLVPTGERYTLTEAHDD